MNRNEIKIKHAELNKIQPFTDKEKITYTKKDQSMIRNIQILNNFTKKKAISSLKMYKGTSKENLARIARNFRKRMKKAYPQNKPEVRGTIRHAQMPSKRTSDNWKQNRKEVNQYLHTPKARQQTNYKKVQTGSKKYPDASKYELMHGVNSKASEKYRERNGQPSKYTGRIIGQNPPDRMKNKEISLPKLGGKKK